MGQQAGDSPAPEADSAPQWLPGDQVLLDPMPQPDSGPHPQPGQPKKRGRGWTITIIALFSAAAIWLAIAVGEWAAQTAEADALVDQIERSEAAMMTAMSTVSAATGGSGSFNGGLSDEAAAELKAAAVRADEEITAASDTIKAASIQPWHGTVITARDAYLAHTAAWQDFLAGAAQEPSAWFIDDQAIESTWRAFKPTLAAVVPTPAVMSLDTRVQQILDEDNSGGDDSGTLQAAGPAAPAS